jgi:hypothetical protein
LHTALRRGSTPTDDNSESDNDDDDEGNNEDNGNEDENETKRQRQHHHRHHRRRPTHVFVVEVPHELDLAQDALRVCEVVERVGDLLDRHLLPSLKVLSGPAGGTTRRSVTPRHTLAHRHARSERAGSPPPPRNQHKSMHMHAHIDALRAVSGPARTATTRTPHTALVSRTQRHHRRHARWV